jgi:hypothetical protein
MWTDTEDNKMQSVQPCILVWQSFSSIRKEEIMLTCLRIRHNCLMHMGLLQSSPTSASIQCDEPITILHIWKELPFTDKCQTLTWSGHVAWHPRIETDMDFFSQYWGSYVYVTDLHSSLQVIYMSCCFKDFTRPYTACLSVIS